MRSVLRKKVTNMSTEEMIDTMYCDSLTGIWNRAAYAELIEVQVDKQPRVHLWAAIRLIRRHPWKIFSLLYLASQEYIYKWVYGEPDQMHVAIVDLDSLKWINDNLGHRAGDEALKEVAIDLSEKFPDQVFRLAGDEFLVYEWSAEALDKKLLDRENVIYSYGTGSTLIEADRGLKEAKSFRVNCGLRSIRGEQPPWDYERFRSSI